MLQATWYHTRCYFVEGNCCMLQCSIVYGGLSEAASADSNLRVGYIYSAHAIAHTLYMYLPILILHTLY